METIFCSRIEASPKLDLISEKIVLEDGDHLEIGKKIKIKIFNRIFKIDIRSQNDPTKNRYSAWLRQWL